MTAVVHVSPQQDLSYPVSNSNHNYVCFQRESDVKTNGSLQNCEGREPGKEHRWGGNVPVNRATRPLLRVSPNERSRRRDSGDTAAVDRSSRCENPRSSSRSVPGTHGTKTSVLPFLRKGWWHHRANRRSAGLAQDAAGLPPGCRHGVLGKERRPVSSPRPTEHPENRAEPSWSSQPPGPPTTWCWANPVSPFPDAGPSFLHNQACARRVPGVAVRPVGFIRQAVTP